MSKDFTKDPSSSYSNISSCSHFTKIIRPQRIHSSNNTLKPKRIIAIPSIKEYCILKMKELINDTSRKLGKTITLLKSINISEK